jgi:hypothetical protein
MLLQISEEDEAMEVRETFDDKGEEEDDSSHTC